MLPTVVVALVHCVPDTPNNNSENNKSNNYHTQQQHQQQQQHPQSQLSGHHCKFLHGRSTENCLCSFIFYTLFLFTLLMVLLFLVACCKLQFPVAFLLLLLLSLLPAARLFIILINLF